MPSRGHVRSDLRHLHLHRVALDKLRRHPELRQSCLALVEQWLRHEENEPSRPWLTRWREMLSSWSLDRIAETVLDPEGGQTLRQCSPLAPALTPQERWAALEEVEQSLAGESVLDEGA
ncbi:MAG: hypothetical protein ACREQY_17905 [Candidatus Binatia bacterium]